MVSPARRKEAVQEVRSALEVSERRACKVIGQPRSTQRYVATKREKDQPLVKRMLELVGQHPRYGYRRIWALLRTEGFRVNRKRVHRLWRKEGLKVPKKQRKKRRLGSSEHGWVRHRAEHANHVWCYDFVSDQTEDGRTLKFLTLDKQILEETLRGKW